MKPPAGAGRRAHHPEDFPRVMQDWPRSIATGEPFDMESRIRRKDGEFRWFLMRAEPLAGLQQRGRAVVRHEHGYRRSEADAPADDARRGNAAVRISSPAGCRRAIRTCDSTRSISPQSGKRSSAATGTTRSSFRTATSSSRSAMSIGHGIGAAVTAGRIRQAIFAVALDILDPATILTKVNRMLGLQENTSRRRSWRSSTRVSRIIRYASAGHPPPIVAATGGIRAHRFHMAACRSASRRPRRPDSERATAARRRHPLLHRRRHRIPARHRVRRSRRCGMR